MISSKRKFYKSLNWKFFNLVYAFFFFLVYNFYHANNWRFYLFKALHFSCSLYSLLTYSAAAAAAKSLQSCPTVRPHRQQPTRLPRPWDSPGKNTGVGCHFLLQRMKMKSENEVAQLCSTLSNPMDCSLPIASVHWIFQARDWGGVQLPSPYFLCTYPLYPKTCFAISFVFLRHA